MTPDKRMRTSGRKPRVVHENDPYVPHLDAMGNPIEPGFLFTYYDPEVFDLKPGGVVGMIKSCGESYPESCRGEQYRPIWIHRERLGQSGYTNLVATIVYGWEIIILSGRAESEK